MVPFELLCRLLLASSFRLRSCGVGGAAICPGARFLEFSPS